MPAPPTGFVTYIDEAGDEGFKFDCVNHSSEWLVISAVVVRKTNDPRLFDLIQSYKKLIEKKRDYTIHFRTLNHTQRLPLVGLIANAPIRAVTVLCRKRLLTQTEKLREKHKLYFYLTRYLLERVSWLCWANRGVSSPRTEIVFSNRSNMAYGEIQTYLDTLENSTPAFQPVKIDWRVIDKSAVIALPHRQRAGLQIADAVASSLFCAVEPGSFGFSEPRYGKMLLPITYKKGQSPISRGLKFFPSTGIDQFKGNADYDWLNGQETKKAGSGPEDPGS